MYLPITTSPQTIAQLIDAYDVEEGNPVGQTQSIVTKRANRNVTPSIGFDLTGITANIRINGVYDADLVDSPRLAAFGPIGVEKFSYVSLISDAPVNVPVLIL